MSGWSTLLTEARTGSRLAASPWHGERHWRAVAALGLALAADDPRLDAGVLLAFGLLHDCRREDEARDPGHGHRSAAMARDSAALLALLGPGRRDAVVHACDIHNGAPAQPVEADPSVAACLDADRLTLRRVGIEPDPARLSLPRVRAELPRWLTRAEALTGDPPEWQALFAALPARSPAPHPNAPQAPGQRPRPADQVQTVEVKP